MSYYAIQAWTGDEGKFLHIASRRLETQGARLLWPRRSLKIRKGGVLRDSLAPIFPSYIFLQSEGVDPEMYWTIKRVPGFVRFLPFNEGLKPLDGRDQDLLSHFLSFGEVVEKSMVVFDENSRIRVIVGPLKGLEGSIIKVDRRKGRAKVKLEMYQDSFTVDFRFESLEGAVERNAGPPGPT